MEITEMKYDEFIVAYKIAHSEGWNIGKQDHKTIVDKSGFFALKIEGDIVAVIACIKYGISYANVGLYIVKNDYRGKGYGYKLWNTAMETVKERNVGLDSTMLQVSRYLLRMPYLQYLFSRYFYHGFF